ncbi:hypothetical protein [Prosthecobacter sp.]|uniref:hypothetical protein n=1 Tax=Prosthecobacter sp. TaxID=1965333 RepID=UPI003784178A
MSDESDYVTEEPEAPVAKPVKARAVKKEKKAAKAGGNPRRGKMAAGADGKAAFESGGGAAAPKFFEAAAVCEELKLWWNHERGDAFLLRGPDGRWAQWTKDAVVDAMRSLPGRMIAIKARDGEMLSESKMVLMHARQHRALDGVIPSLPGYGSGIHTLDSGEKVLVKHEPVMVEPVKGTWENVKLLIDNLLDRSGEGGKDQAVYFHAWCQVAARAIREGEPGHWRAGHAMILTGPAGCGKNRLQEQIITPLLGGYGRFADPAKFLFESDEFNGDVFAAEHLMLSEIPLPSQRTMDRTSLAEKIKQVVANPAQRMRLMRTEPCSVSPFWRLTISVNDDKDKLRSLPLITGDFGDKVLIFHCAKKPLPIIERDSIESQKRFREVMAEELPCYLDWLLNEFVIPEEMLSYGDGRSATRFGFREYHAPIIKEGLFDDTPHAELLRLVDMARFTSVGVGSWGGGDDADEGRDLSLWDLDGDKVATGPNGARLRLWWGRAETLQMLLCNDDKRWTCSVATMAKKLFQHSSKCGVLLGRLYDDEAMRDTRIDRKNTEHWKGWVIAPPTV